MQSIIPLVIFLIPLAGIGGWVITTWIRARHGYPLDDGAGNSVHPNNNSVLEERVRELSADVRILRDRVAVLERIATDRPTALDREIEALRDPV